MKSLLLDFLMGKNQSLPITNREKECLSHIKSGYTAKEIARLMSISYRTVQNHVENIKTKLGCQKQTQIVSLLLEGYRRAGFSLENPVPYNLEIFLNLSIPHAIFWKDKDRMFRGCNKQFASQFGYNDAKKIIEKTDYDFPFAPDLVEKYQNDDNHVLRTGIPKINYEESQSQLDGTIKTVLVSKTPFRDDDGNIIGILGIYNDITEHKRQIEILQQAKEAAETVNKANIMLLKNIQHDTRTPLENIMNFANMIKNEVDNPTIKKYADRLLASGNTLSQLLNEALAEKTK